MATHGRQCQVCHRAPASGLTFNCCTCTREALYLPRLKLARVLLLKETLSKDLERVVKSTPYGQAQDSTSSAHDGTGEDSFRRESTRSQYRLIAARTQIILDDSRNVQEEIERMRKQLSDMRASITKRKRSLEVVTQEIHYEEEASLRPLQESITSLGSTWDKLHDRISHDRHILPKELASLYGLQIRKRRRGSHAYDDFILSGVPIFNIKELNSAVPEQLNISTYHVAHLVHLAAHYLGLRLPAEISLASAGQPYTHIFPLMSSYKASALDFGSRELSAGKFHSRRRLLWTDRPLPQLASEDPQAYSLYLDAVILLAWDVAWLAKTQGIDVGSKGWEDICLVGKNLWDLFGRATGSAQDEPQKPNISSTKDVIPTDQHSSVGFRSFSQSSAHNFLNSAGSSGAGEYMKTWKYSAPNKIIEVIKSALAHERMGDWEVLEKPEERSHEEEATGMLIGDSKQNNKTKLKAETELQG